MAKALLRQALNEVEMLKLREAQRQRDDVDLGCLTAEHRTEFKQRELQSTTSIARESIERMSFAMQRQSPAAHKERVAAQYTLDRCEAALPAGTDQSSACIAERAELAKLSLNTSPPQELPVQMRDLLTRMARARAAIRAEYPACDKVQ